MFSIKDDYAYCKNHDNGRKKWFWYKKFKQNTCIYLKIIYNNI